MSDQTRYKARAKSWGMGKTANGREQVAIGFEILNPIKLEDGSNWESFLTWYGYFTDGTFERTVDSLRYCGWQGDDLDELARGEGGLDANEVELVVGDEEYEGKVTRKVQWVNRAGGVALKERLAPEESKVFAASMKDRIRALQAAKGERPAQQKAAAPQQQRRALPPPQAQTPASSGTYDPREPPPMTDSDIPF